MTNADVRAIRLADDGSRVGHLEVAHGSHLLQVHASRYVVAAGAVNTAVLLLRSRTERLPAGVANSSDCVGRHYMAHTSTFVVGVRPGPDRHLVFEKTLGLNDWYHAGPTNEFPLGNIQSVGKLQGPMIKSYRKVVPMAILEWMTRRSVDFFVETEDLPRPENRVRVDDSDRVHLNYRPNNLVPHMDLIRRLTRALRRCGYPLIFTHQLPIAATSHQCGTARMGTDPATSVIDERCRAHDHENLWIVDASVFPSAAAVNPALTVAANALRVAALGDLTA
jgi:choline dehydrogenase-like flavoprotein